MKKHPLGNVGWILTKKYNNYEKKGLEKKQTRFNYNQLTFVSL